MLRRKAAPNAPMASPQSGRKKAEGESEREIMTTKQKTAERVIMFQQQIHVGLHDRFWYVADLPGCDKDKRNGTRCDWGWTTDINKALPLTPYWAKRFAAFCKRDRCRPWGTARIVEAR